MLNKYILILFALLVFAVGLFFSLNSSDALKHKDKYEDEHEITITESITAAEPELSDSELLDNKHLSNPTSNLSDKSSIKTSESQPAKNIEVDDPELNSVELSSSFDDEVGLEIKDGNKYFDTGKVSLRSIEQLEDNLDKLTYLANNDPIVVETKLAYESRIVTISAEQNNSFNLRQVECSQHVCIAQLDLNDESQFEEIKSSFYRAKYFQNGLAGFSTLTRQATQQKEQLNFYFTTTNN